jgi:hypothetical protein
MEKRLIEQWANKVILRFGFEFQILFLFIIPSQELSEILFVNLTTLICSIFL